jgi:hypothetical protein
MLDTRDAPLMGLPECAHHLGGTLIPDARELFDHLHDVIGRCVRARSSHKVITRGRIVGSLQVLLYTDWRDASSATGHVVVFIVGWQSGVSLHVLIRPAHRLHLDKLCVLAEISMSLVVAAVWRSCWRHHAGDYALRLLSLPQDMDPPQKAVQRDGRDEWRRLAPRHPSLHRPSSRGTVGWRGVGMRVS